MRKRKEEGLERDHIEIRGRLLGMREMLELLSTYELHGRLTKVITEETSRVAGKIIVGISVFCNVDAAAPIKIVQYFSLCELNCMHVCLYKYTSHHRQRTSLSSACE